MGCGLGKRIEELRWSSSSRREHRPPEDRSVSSVIYSRSSRSHIC
ncbi:hypothetical protein HanRHA438_Chr12g0570431 [Helianthus annuus]|uniref:Uncharacterized protein n=1 Tax=Helianthus annuus TaxID=4232 RepID=A0A9K3HJF1_HELAN|nr:hypothetical protein HanXRQr2_Chr12g0559091 [Helianthus annuus]KAJ0490673.1 hypothetical protein HanHA300_Chr12g0458211 [Helianthus annuus]KAJ0494964.1 hypothetical protein HanIR_Chr12g0603471 [Helianthus annuus]KAJ0506594.1 hypothetical protein HanHA89_Chr12g0483811 [Helianthus annuus]KAJ0676268.1 hypothetical protein HanLR1_Chr12g0460781 [Helianthus annuus]